MSLEASLSYWGELHGANSLRQMGFFFVMAWSGNFPLLFLTRVLYSHGAGVLALWLVTACAVLVIL